MLDYVGEETKRIACCPSGSLPPTRGTPRAAADLYPGRSRIRLRAATTYERKMGNFLLWRPPPSNAGRQGATFLLKRDHSSPERTSTSDFASSCGSILSIESSGAPTCFQWDDVRRPRRHGRRRVLAVLGGRGRDGGRHRCRRRGRGHHHLREDDRGLHQSTCKSSFEYVHDGFGSSVTW